MVKGAWVEDIFEKIVNKSSFMITFPFENAEVLFA